MVQISCCKFGATKLRPYLQNIGHNLHNDGACKQIEYITLIFWWFRNFSLHANILQLMSKVRDWLMMVDS